MALSCPYSFGGGILEYGDGIPMVGSNRDPAGCDTILANHEYFNADMTFVLADPFGLLKCSKDLAQIPLTLWAPIDTNPCGEGDIQVIRDSQAHIVAMSRYGERVLNAEGVQDVLYVPHAVDCDTFCPGDAQPYRDTVPGIGPDTFVIGMVALNRDPLRKGFQETLLAFSRFHARHPDTHLALHTAEVGGINLPGMAARLGIGSSISFPDGYCYSMNLIDRPALASFYNGIDVLSMASYGEGFGLPLIEAQAAGTPVICTDASAMSELCGAGWLVSGSPFWSNGHGAWWCRPDVDDLEQGYELAYATWQDAKKWTALKESARAFALNYDIDRVFPQFMVPAFKELEARIA
jgi:glycosyltransferase involved in cell wall biosynthesis